jgi:hypothetical protein
MQLIVLGIVLAGGWIYWKVHQPTPLFVGLLAGALVAIVNSIKVLNGFTFINPFVKA